MPSFANIFGQLGIGEGSIVLARQRRCPWALLLLFKPVSLTPVLSHETKPPFEQMVSNLQLISTADRGIPYCRLSSCSALISASRKDDDNLESPPLPLDVDRWRYESGSTQTDLIRHFVAMHPRCKRAITKTNTCSSGTTTTTTTTTTITTVAIALRECSATLRMSRNSVLDTKTSPFQEAKAVCSVQFWLQHCEQNHCVAARAWIPWMLDCARHQYKLSAA